MTLSEKTIKLPFPERTAPLRYYLAHSAYWLLITGFFLYEKRYLIHKASLPYFFACVSVRILLLVLISYLNLQYFLPNFLLKKKYWAYFLAVSLSVIGYLAVQSLFDYYLYGYVIGPMRGSRLMETLWYNFFSTLWYLGLMLALKLSMDWYSQQLTIQKITVEKLNAEVDFLRSQVNPHFLFNALSNLYGLTLKKSDQAPEAVLMLSGLMEYMLYESNDEQIPLDKELEYLENYIELERLRSDNDTDIRVRVNGPADQCMVAPFLILPLLENAIKHGISANNQPAFLYLDIAVGATLEVKLSNSLPDSQAADRKGGIGLENLRKRLDLLYPGKHVLQTRKLPGKYETILQIDLT